MRYVRHKTICILGWFAEVSGEEYNIKNINFNLINT